MVTCFFVSTRISVKSFHRSLMVLINWPYFRVSSVRKSSKNGRRGDLIGLLFPPWDTGRSFSSFRDEISILSPLAYVRISNKFIKEDWTMCYKCGYNLMKDNLRSIKWNTPHSSVLLSLYSLSPPLSVLAISSSLTSCFFDEIWLFEGTLTIKHAQVKVMTPLSLHLCRNRDEV